MVPDDEEVNRSISGEDSLRDGTVFWIDGVGLIEGV